MTVTSRAASVPLRTSVRSVTESPTRRKRGSAGRTSSGCVTSNSLSPSPTCVSAVAARASARQVVVLSGKCSSKLALPASSVVSCPIQSAVFWKSERTRGSVLDAHRPPGDGSAVAAGAAGMYTGASPSGDAFPRAVSASASSPFSASRYVSFQRFTRTVSDEAGRTPSSRSYQNAAMPSGPTSSASASTALSTTATATSASTPRPSASVTVTS